MKYMNILKWSAGVAGLMLVSCNSWLDVKPDDKILEDDLLTDEDGFNMALNGIYLGMADGSVYGKELSCGYLEALAQMYKVNQQATAAPNRYVPFTQYLYENDVVKAAFQATWGQMYILIANCNNLIEKAPGKQAVFVPESDFNQYLGRLYALRAFLHFDVFRLWGPVYSESTKGRKCIPYYKKRTSLPVRLSTAEAVIGDVLGDLRVADSLMSENKSALQMDIDYLGVRALMARVYLYAGEKTKAYETARGLIGPQGIAEKLYPFVTRASATASQDPDRLYYSEQIFLLENSQRNNLYEDLFDYMLAEQVFLAPSAERIADLFPESADFRYFQWEINPGNGKGVSFIKFAKITDNNAPVRTRSQSLLKVSELYLILAECAPDETERQAYLEKLRVGRGYQSGSITDKEKSDWKMTLQTEYNREFYGEGQFFFYLKRNNVSTIKAAEGNNDVTLGPARYELPLPDSESKYR